MLGIRGMRTWYNQAQHETRQSGHKMLIEDVPVRNLREYLQGMVNMRKKYAREHGKPKGWHYLCHEDLLLQHGKFYVSQPLTPEELAAVKSIGSMSNYKQQLCFYNAQKIATTYMKFAYVEGVAWASGIPIPMSHAWNTINDKVVDVTWKHMNSGEPILGKFPKDMEYCGVPVSVKSIHKLWGKTGNAYSILDFPINVHLFKRKFDPDAPEQIPQEFFDEYARDKTNSKNWSDKS